MTLRKMRGTMKTDLPQAHGGIRIITFHLNTSYRKEINAIMSDMLTSPHEKVGSNSYRLIRSARKRNMK